MQGVAQSLHDAALNLAVNGARVQRAADVLDDAVAQHFDMTGLPVDSDLAVVDSEDGDVDRVDEMTGDASRHGRHAAPCEGAGAGDRADLCLSMGGDLGDRTAGARCTVDLDTPIAHHQVIGRRLDHLRGHLQQFLAHLLRCGEAGGTKRNRGAAAADADIVAGGIGVGRAHDHVFRTETECGGDDLGKSLHHRTGADFDTGCDECGCSVGVHVHGRRRWADKDEPGADRGSAAVEPAVGALGRLCGRHAQRIHAVEHRAEHVTFKHLAGCSEVAVAEYIAAAEGEGIYADPGGDLIGVPFEREGVVDAVASAEGAVRGGVGVDRPRDQPH